MISKRNKNRKRYDADMAALEGGLTAAQGAFLRDLVGGDGAATVRYDLARDALSRPQRACVEAFARGGEAFEQIADRTGYLIDDIYMYITTAVRAIVGEFAVVEEVVVAEDEVVDSRENIPYTEPAPAPDDDWFDERKPSGRGKIWVAAVAVLIAVAGLLALRHYRAEPIVELPAETVEQQEDAPDIPAEVAEADAMSYAALPDSLNALPDADVGDGRALLAFISKEPDGQPTSKPKIGRSEYNDYLSAAAMPLPEDSHGDVTLTFRVNPYGRPSQIRVTSVLSREANHEAIRLLANGPEWTESQRTVTITIRFR